jgi:hypothetical protein
MGVTVTGSPSSVVPGQVVGAPIRVPYLLLCTQGERWCGTHWAANTRRQLVQSLSSRRDHESKCNGGIVLAS